MSEWIEWNGGEMPVPSGTKIEVRHSDGDEFITQAGGRGAARWRHIGTEEDIVAYKILEPITPQLYGAIPDLKGHQNASILMEIAKEAAINPEYWKEYEVKFYDEEMTIEWIVCRNESDLFYGLQNDINIRRKPRTIRIGNYDVPEPNDFGVNWDRELLIKFETKEGAELMLKALQELLAGK